MQEPDYFNLITPKINDKILDIEISFSDRRGIKDKVFRDQVIDEVYNIIFSELTLSSLGIQFKDNREIISFKMMEEENDPATFFFIYEQLKLLSDVEPNFKFSIKGLTFNYIKKYKKLKEILLT